MILNTRIPIPPQAAKIRLRLVPIRTQITPLLPMGAPPIKNLLFYRKRENRTTSPHSLHRRFLIVVNDQSSYWTSASAPSYVHRFLSVIPPAPAPWFQSAYRIRQLAPYFRLRQLGNRSIPWIQEMWYPDRTPCCCHPDSGQQVFHWIYKLHILLVGT